MSESWSIRSSADVLLGEDSEIHAAQVELRRTLRIVSEPGGAAAFAALRSDVYRPAPDERVGVLLCGANTTAVNFPALAA